MQMQSVVITTEEQVVVEITETLELLFSTISYLRNFFPSSYFVTRNIDTVEAKILTPTCDNSSLFISWYKVSVRDAFQKRYLRKLVLAVYLDDSCPEKVSETYTLEFDYEKETFSSIFQMIRTLSLLTQTLSPLPSKKFLTLKLFYNETTPFDYEPEGFKASINHQFLFETEPLELDLNSFRLEQGSSKAFIKSLFDKNSGKEGSRGGQAFREERSTQQGHNLQPVYSMHSEYLSQRSEGFRSLGVNKAVGTRSTGLVSGSPREALKEDTQETGNARDTQATCSTISYADLVCRDVYSQRCIKEVVPSSSLLKKDSDAKKNDNAGKQPPPKNPTSRKNKASVISAKLRSKAKEDEVKCICSINISDSDMLYCDSCKFWLHTVCCGFFTNTDRRIPSGKYTCIMCTEKSTKSLYFYRNLAIFRRTLGIIYNENLESVSWLSQRLGISHNYSKNTVNRLVNEGFVAKRKTKSGMVYEVVKTQETKEKIKEYFTLGLKKFKVSVPVKDVKCE